MSQQQTPRQKEIQIRAERLQNHFHEKIEILAKDINADSKLKYQDLFHAVLFCALAEIEVQINEIIIEIKKLKQ